ncbi:MFS transporter [Sphingomonas sp. SUN019]|uniref:MFS transporter n=1 Tax=Sphingomonas sp. SUN019 TaxID=2937788 RepID=UPI002164E0F0|nr:MFS transporter [Sphingomonas sp. SUN019]UVO50631.1 MFS transporter [Sphingomonas sp. SUN019]
MNRDPRAIIDDAPMSRLQIAAVAITVGLNALDGFDVLSISFASPGIAAEWGVERAALGVVLSMELIGMAVGSVLLGGLADRIGRRKMMLGCLVTMLTGMFMASRASGIGDLSVWRVLTGLGIGGMLATVNAVTAEFANARRRNICLALMTIGYPIGAVIGGSVAALLLKGGDWRAVFEFGAIVTACFIPLVWFFIPESVHYLVDRRPAGALARINATLTRMQHPAIDVLPTLTAAEEKRSITDIFSPALLRTTILVTLGYFAHAVTFYFILKWSPKIIVDLGFDPSSAAGVLVWTNVGGATGGAIFGLLAQKFDLKRLTLFTLAVSSLTVALFGASGASTLMMLSALACLSGFFTNAAIVGYYTIFARAFPSHVRATGTGFAIGVGRGGAALSPMLAGFLFAGGVGLGGVAIVMACGSLVSLAALAFTRLRIADVTHGVDEPEAIPA